MSYRTNRKNGGIFKPGGRISKAMDADSANRTRDNVEKVISKQSDMWKEAEDRVAKYASDILAKYGGQMTKEQFFSLIGHVMFSSSYPDNELRDAIDNGIERAIKNGSIKKLPNPDPKYRYSPLVSL